MLGCAAQPVRRLLSDGIEDFRMAAGVVAETRVRDFGDFAFSLGTYAGTPCLVVLEQTHCAKEVAGIQVGNDRFLAVFVFEDYRDRPIDDVVEGFTLVTLVDDGGLVGGKDACARGSGNFPGH